MANLLTRLRGGDTSSRSHPSISWDDYQQQIADFFSFGGVEYPILNQTMPQGPTEDPDPAFMAQLELMRQVPPAFAAQLVRATALSQVRFQFRRTRSSRQGPPGSLFGTSALGLLERPWPNGTTGELVSRMEWHVGLEGNAFVVRQARRLRLLRPDWVWIFHGSERNPDDPLWQLDAELLGYGYQPGGLGSNEQMEMLLPEEVAHWDPIPDPSTPNRGMSWFTPAIREALGDKAVTEFKRAFFRNSATPNLVVKGLLNAAGQIPTPDQLKEIVKALEDAHAGVRKAFKTLYLTQGADATVVGADLSQIDLKNVQGGFETRIAYLSRVPAVVLNIAEGMQGSSLNSGNFAQAKANFNETWLIPVLQDLSSTLGTVIRPPADAELWWDPVDMAILRKDAEAAANVRKTDAEVITRLVREGFTAESAKAYLQSGDISDLVHTGLLSVQLQQPGVQLAPNGQIDVQNGRRYLPVPPGVLPPAPKALPWRSEDDQDDH